MDNTRKIYCKKVLNASSNYVYNVTNGRRLGGKQYSRCD